MKPMFSAALLGAIILAGAAQGASLILDSFTEGEHFLSLGGRTGTGMPITGPAVTNRSSTLSVREAAPGTTMTSTLSTTAGTLDFFVDGVSINSRPLNLRLGYRMISPLPFSFSGYSALEFDFSAMSGTGHLIVELGSGSDIYGPETHRILLNEPGTVLVPFDQLNFGAGGSVDSFLFMHFAFEAASEQFSFTLDEVRAVPEPSSAALMAGFGVFLLTARRRREERQPNLP